MSETAIMPQHKTGTFYIKLPPHHQSGAALIISLVLLLALTIIGIGSLNKSSLEQRMAGNMGDLNLAFNATETASRGYTLAVTASPNHPPSLANCNGIAGPCLKTGLDNDWWNDPDKRGHDWWMANAQIYSGDIALVKTNPHVIAESQDFTSDSLTQGHRYDGSSGVNYYRLTVRGTGLSNNSEAIIQQTLAKRYN